MSWEAIARKDFQDAARSVWLWALSAIFVGVLATPPALIVLDVIQIGGEDGLTTDLFVFLMRDTMTLLVPVIAIVVAYASVAGERDAGTLKILLSLPHSRLDVVVGKAVGRGGVVALPILAGFAVAALVFLATPVTFKAATYFGFAALTVALGLVFVSVAVGVSAAADTGRRAMIGTVGLFALLTLFWNQFAGGVIRLLRDHTGLGGDVRVPLHLLLKAINPTQAYKTLVARLFTDGAVAARVDLIGGAGLQGALNRQMYAQTLGESVPVYLSDPAMAAIVLVWLVGAPLVGYAVFREADL